MVRVVIAGLVAGVALFMWGFASWVVLTWHNRTFRELPQEKDLVAAFREHLPLTDSQTTQSGAYRIPWIVESELETDEARQKAEIDWRNRHLDGPVAYLFYSEDGSDPMAPQRLAAGVGLDMLIGFFAALAVFIALPGRPNFFLRVGLVLAMGFFTVLMTHVTDWNFMYRPDDYTLIMCADNLIGSLVVGIVVAAIVRPGPKPATV